MPGVHFTKLLYAGGSFYKAIICQEVILQGYYMQGVHFTRLLLAKGSFFQLSQAVTGYYRMGGHFAWLL